jgi:UDP-N-acetylglucosamine--N-acetylmuramyl-(pentapeptide) pyrophosphoryl-undecaprenol N-acetylglucosamine transferase
VKGVYVLAAGGTGGHLFPAEAVARILVGSGSEVHLFTDRRMDAFAETVPGVTVNQVHAGRIGGGAFRTAAGLVELAVGFIEAHRRLRRLAPAAVVGFGGYPSVPTMLAATRLGLPTLIHEQNVVLGRANRLLASRVRRIATGFAVTVGLRPADESRAIHTGNPVRAAIHAVGALPYVPPATGEPVELLVVGGSQGARFFGEIVPAAFAELPSELRSRLRLSQQARPEDVAEVAATLQTLGVAAEVKTFFDDMPERLARAHLVICRAGASTLSELAVAGRPAILVPYPYAADDHQTANARVFDKEGAGWRVAQKDLTPAGLADRLVDLLSDPAGLLAAAGAARRLARDDAAEHLAGLVQSLVRGLGGGIVADATLERAA